MPVWYVIRVRADIWVHHRGYQGALSGTPIGRGQVIWWPTALVHQQERCCVNVAIALNATAEEPWYLVTNLKRGDTTVRWYERRFPCEELFRDVKDQLHLETL